MTTREAIVEEARAWINTPYRHQQHARGVGTDCGGLIGGIAIAVGALPGTWWETDFSPHAGYARQPSNGSLERICDSFMERLDPDDARPGDVVGLRWAREVMHLALLVPYFAGGYAIVHALAPRGRVVEHRLSPVWRARIALVH